MSGVSHLKAEDVTFLGTDVHRRATPKVTSVDVGSVSQKVLDDQVVVGGDGDLKGCLCHTVPVSHFERQEQEGDGFLPVRCVLSSRARPVEPFSEPARMRGHVCHEQLQCEESCKWKLVRISL